MRDSCAYLVINQMIQLHAEGYFAANAYVRGLYHYPEETKDDLMLSWVFTINISAAFVVFGMYNIVCGVIDRIKESKIITDSVSEGGESFRPFGRSACSENTDVSPKAYLIYT